MRMVDVIAKKRDGEELSEEEIQFFISGLTSGDIPDYQAAALLMAVYIQGMNEQETIALTKAMLYSGDTVDLSAIAGIKVDKHSTGGVGDKTTIVLAPLVAAAGAPVAKMTGSGLGHTGGTMDKLRSFANINMELSREEFINNVQRIGIAVSGQSAKLVPADKKLYALRDVTSTIGNIPLIAASIMSKKLASGSDAIVLDVKTGSGAFMESEEGAFQLAKEMVKIGEGMKRQTVAVISQMAQPLGRAVGNTLEVKEALETLNGRGPADLLELCLELGSHMLVLSNIVPDAASARTLLKQKIQSGEALAKLKEMIKYQGGNPDQVDDISSLPHTSNSRNLVSSSDGYVSQLDARTVGIASMLLGAGRKTKEDKIDLAAGIYLHKKIGEAIQEGEVLATLYATDTSKFDEAIATLQTAYRISSDPVTGQQLILGAVRK